MGAFLGFIFMIGGIIYLVKYFSDKYAGAERWCEGCNTWSVMKLTGDLKGDYFTCTKCGQRNKKNRGCPHCGWFARFENRYVGRVGPFSEMVDFYSSVLIFKETWNCPKHGNYLCVVTASESRNYRNFEEEEREREEADSYDQGQY